MQNVRTSAKVFSGSYRNFCYRKVNKISESFIRYLSSLLTYSCIIVIGAVYA